MVAPPVLNMEEMTPMQEDPLQTLNTRYEVTLTSRLRELGSLLFSGLMRRERDIPKNFSRGNMLS